VWSKKTLLILIPAIAVALVVTYSYIHSRSRHGPNLVRVSGDIEVTDAEVSFKIAGRTEARLVTEGETVRVGQVVARLDSMDLAQEVALHKAEVHAPQSVSTRLGRLAFEGVYGLSSYAGMTTSNTSSHDLPAANSCWISSSKNRMTSRPIARPSCP
jgi:hypothetical protein